MTLTPDSLAKASPISWKASVRLAAPATTSSSGDLSACLSTDSQEQRNRLPAIKTSLIRCRRLTSQSGVGRQTVSSPDSRRVGMKAYSHLYLTRIRQSINRLPPEPRCYAKLCPGWQKEH